MIPSTFPLSLVPRLCSDTSLALLLPQISVVDRPRVQTRLWGGKVSLFIQRFPIHALWMDDWCVYILQAFAALLITWFSPICKIILLFPVQRFPRPSYVNK